jgi:two-component system, chemotaxis family, sensor kinase Cph1
MDKRLLATCETERLHLSGAIMPHGCLICVAADGSVRQVSANIVEWLGGDIERWLEHPLPEYLAAFLATLSPAAGSRSVVRSAIAAQQSGRGCELDLVACRNDTGAITLEFFEHRSDAESIVACKPGVIAIADQATALAAADALVNEIRSLTGFQRIMLYQFREDGDGEVVAETRDSDVYGSYLGLRFPASDIPQIARVLYRRNPWRLIPDAAAADVPLTGCEAGAPDLTYSDLRSVSVMHRIYLANMGVAASLSYPVVVGGVLAALIACHHSRPSQPGLDVLGQVSLLVRNYAMALTDYQSRHRMRLVDGMATRFDAARAMVRRHGSIAEAWPELGAWLMHEFKADGAILCQDNDSMSVGHVPSPDSLAVLDQWFIHRKGEVVWLCDSLIRQIPQLPLTEVAGVLALHVHVARLPEMRIYLCRLEDIHEVMWGGNPEKPVEYHDGALGIAPRRSFEKWVEKRLGYSRNWDNETRLLAFKLRELMLREFVV